jgi:hypothetical protein
MTIHAEIKILEDTLARLKAKVAADDRRRLSVLHQVSGFIGAPSRQAQELRRDIDGREFK